MFEEAFVEAVLQKPSPPVDNVDVSDNWQTALPRDLLRGVEFLEAPGTKGTAASMHAVIFHRSNYHPVILNKLHEILLPLAKIVFPGQLQLPDIQLTRYIVDCTVTILLVHFYPQGGETNIAALPHPKLCFRHPNGLVELMGYSAQMIFPSAPSSIMTIAAELPTSVKYKNFLSYGISGGIIPAYQSSGKSGVIWILLQQRFQFLYIAGMTQSLAVLKTDRRTFPGSKIWPLDCSTPEDWREARALARLFYDFPDNVKRYSNCCRDEIESAIFSDGKGSLQEQQRIERFGKSVSHIQGVFRTKWHLSRGSMPDFEGGNPWRYRKRYLAQLVQLFGGGKKSTTVSKDEQILDSFIDRPDGDALLYFLKISSNQSQLSKL